MNVAVVGATGAVGRKMVKVLEERKFCVDNLRLFASERSVGKRIEFFGEEILVEKLSESSFSDVDIALFSAGTKISKEFAHIAVKAGAVVVDNSSCFRMEPDVPLVVPEVNPQDLEWHKGIIANPNCSTIQMVVVLAPLNKCAKIKRVVVSTYQSVSGTGQKAIDELRSQTEQIVRGEEVVPSVYPYQIAFNLFPHIDIFLENGYTKEEQKMVAETKKIMGADFGITATCVRVPVFVGHSEAVNIEFERPITEVEAREILESAEGVVVIDEVNKAEYPYPMMAEERDEVFVGRIRKDYSVPNGLNLWIVADNLRKGAATNAVQIVEKIVAKA
jgi:aspartate-semialdehyde dehydrogenase